MIKEVNFVEAAMILDKEPTYFYKKMKEYGFDGPRKLTVWVWEDERND